MNSEKRNRIANALWGLFIGDALAMPVHWYYSRKNIYRDFPNGIRGYEAPKHPHPESFMVGMSYRPDVDTAGATGRPFDILHEHARFYSTPYSDLSIERTDQESQHGNAVPSLNERYHYHHGLAAGENTLAAHLVRVLVRSILHRGRYDQDGFLNSFVEHMTTPGRNRDPYTEIYIRHWFQHYTAGLPIDRCADTQRNTWSIGSHGGMMRPLVLALLAHADGPQAVGLAFEHQNLTHRSENVAASLYSLIPIIQDAVAGRPLAHAIRDHAKGIRKPVVSGTELFEIYRRHDGPGNIPDDLMWRLHTELQPFNLEAMVKNTDENDAINGVFATACYPEHGLPLALFLALKHDCTVAEALFANANAGGDNVHRGAVLGLILGSGADEIPRDLVRGLSDHDALSEEISAFADLAVSGSRLY